MAGQDLDRNEAATPFKLQKARERGEVARSAEVGAAAAFAAAVGYACWQGSQPWQELLAQLARRLARSGQAALTIESASQWIREAMGAAGSLVLPGLLAVTGLAAAACWAQAGGAISTHPLKPDFQRLNPVTGLKRIFSVRTIVEALKTGVKVMVLGVIVVATIRDVIPAAPGLSLRSPAGAARQFAEMASGLALRLAMAICLLAALDAVLARWQFARQMRMSRRELKDEFRQREGDPRVRSRLRELRAELLKRTRAVRQTAQADVVLTNPTHYAVALRYEHGRMAAPQLVAKGAGTLAAVMRGMAARHGIPVVPSPSLARRLFRALEIEAPLPPQFHAEVARIFVWVLAQRESRARAGVAP